MTGLDCNNWAFSYCQRSCNVFSQCPICILHQEQTTKQISIGFNFSLLWLESCIRSHLFAWMYSYMNFFHLVFLLNSFAYSIVVISRCTITSRHGRVEIILSLKYFCHCILNPSSFPQALFLWISNESMPRTPYKWAVCRGKNVMHGSCKKIPYNCEV